EIPMTAEQAADARDGGPVHGGRGVTNPAATWLRAPLACQWTRRSVAIGNDGVRPAFSASQTFRIVLTRCGDRSRLMRMEWLRASDNFPACWACFLVYDDRVDVLAITGSKQRIDRSMSPAEARTLWADLCECGWHCASEEEIVIPGSTEHEAWFREDTEVIDFYGTTRDDFLRGVNSSYINEV